MSGVLKMDFMKPRRDELAELPDETDSASFRRDALKVLDSDDQRDRTMFTGLPDQPVIVAADIASCATLPDLIPNVWQPHLTKLILRAVEDD
ncbi:MULTISPECIES: hypothetical protein [Amycolatopsis]|uniref:hypothetical protein n=1 Tax=Amycolatopsis sp. CB00013 TaxID=1703945 RepID=UPI0011614194|nr:hypothetical protein [Amycolatopsis sp. CB00013]